MSQCVMILLNVDGNVNLLNVDGNVNRLNVYGFEMASNMAALMSHEIVIFWYRYCEVEVKLNLPNVPPRVARIFTAYNCCQN